MSKRKERFWEVDIGKLLMRWFADLSTFVQGIVLFFLLALPVIIPSFWMYLVWISRGGE